VPLALLLLASCSKAPATVQLVLATSPDVCSAADLLAQVDSIQIVVSATDGLDGVTNPGPVAGGGEAQDFDGDGRLEIVFTLPRPTAAELPIFEIGLSHNTDRELRFRVLGYPAVAVPGLSSAVAVGGAGTSCRPGEVQRLGTPFNLRPAFRLPKIVHAVPEDGEENVAGLTSIM
jgi:hypothetical protein